MALSANSLIHYTSKFDTLSQILYSNGLKFSYCLENIKSRGSQHFKAGIAMVSFCDIPLSDYKKHFYNKKNTGGLGYYGDYGIGLSKKWARKNGFNPVIYVDTNSYVSTSVRKDFENFIKANLSENLSTSHPTFLYCKNYEGELYRDGNLKRKDYRFYDEREWRLIPDGKTLNNMPPVLDGDLYEINKNQYQRSIRSAIIKFGLEDLSYILVKNDTEKQEIYDVLRKAFAIEGNILNLTSITVLTNDQIIGDF